MISANHLHYLPLPLPLFFLLAGSLFVWFILLQLRILRYAYERLGLSPGIATLVLFGSLLGSYFNIAIAQFPDEQVVSRQDIIVFGMHYVVPRVVEWPGTVIAVNVGGALIPALVSFYLLVRHHLWAQGLLATAIVAAVCHALARPVHGLGIALPVFVPALSTAVVALILSRRHAAPLAYIGGSLGTLIGADLLNLGKLHGLGAPIASIGGAGTFDGIFLTAIVAVLIASLGGRGHAETPRGAAQR